MSKILECVLLSELSESFSHSDLQCFFLENRGTTQASLLVTETVQWHLNRGSPVFAANLDARKCFDRIWHDGLFFRLISLLNPRSWHLLVAWYRHLNAHVTYAGHRSDCFAIKRGTRQGAILSPAFANVFFQPLLGLLDATMHGAYVLGCHVPAVCYADDLMLLSSNARSLGHLLHIVQDFAAFWRLDFACKNQKPLYNIWGWTAVPAPHLAALWPAACCAIGNRTPRCHGVSRPRWLPSRPAPHRPSSGRLLWANACRNIE